MRSHWAQRTWLALMALAMAGVLVGCGPPPPAQPPPPPKPVEQPPPPPLPANRPPTVTASCDPCAVPVGRQLTLTATANDPDGDPLTYRWSAAEGTLTAPTQRQTTWTTGERQSRFAASVTVDDGRGGTATASVDIRAFFPTASMGKPPEEDFPQFPWPPPAWTAHFPLPAALVSAGNERLGDVEQRWQKTLRAAGIEDSRIFAVGTDGFAIMTRFENIGDDGAPLPGPQRWNALLSKGRGGFLDVIKAIFVPQKSRIRFLVLLATSRPVTSVAAIDEPALSALKATGGIALPPSIAAVQIPAANPIPGYVLVYEYFSPAEDQIPALVKDGTITARRHILAAGLWDANALGR